MRKYDVAIIGAGTAGLTARREVVKKTDNYVVIDGGPLGTTCARVGCMPSKVLIQAANDYHRRHKLSTMGIYGGENLSIDVDRSFEHVRSLRDRFVRGVMSGHESWEDKLIRGYAKFIDANTLEVNGEKIEANKIIIATGSRPIIPEAWNDFKEHLLTTDQLFEQKEIPKSLAVIGLGVIGVELGQALSRLGINTVGISQGKRLGGLTDPKIQDYVIKKLKEEMEISLEGAEEIQLKDSKLHIKSGDKQYIVDKAVVSIGRKPNLDKLNLEALNVNLDPRGIPLYNKVSFQLEQLPHIYLVGDVNGDRPILHEAADEGRIAGYAAVNEDPCFRRRTELGITFSDPNIATIGKRLKEIEASGMDFVTGEVSFEGQGRSIVKLKEQGILHIYAEKENGKILGAELQAPEGEHLAHLIAWAISLNLSVREALSLPFYHPVVEEGLRTALRDAGRKISNPPSSLELLRCQDPPIR